MSIGGGGGGGGGFCPWRGGSWSRAEGVVSPVEWEHFFFGEYWRVKL